MINFGGKLLLLTRLAAIFNFGGKGRGGECADTTTTTVELVGCCTFVVKMLVFKTTNNSVDVVINKTLNVTIVVVCAVYDVFPQRFKMAA